MLVGVMKAGTDVGLEPKEFPMPNYVLTYHGGSGEMPTDPAEIEKTMEAWGAWYGTIGAALVDGGAPFGEHGSVGGSGVPAPTLSGYTIVTADDMDGAKKIAGGCPVLEGGATVQISQAIDM